MLFYARKLIYTIYAICYINVHNMFKLYQNVKRVPTHILCCIVYVCRTKLSSVGLTYT